jgi:hypothetical protein
MVQVIRVEVIGDHQLRLEFSDGSLREVDIEPLLHGPLLEPLREPEVLRQVYVDPDLGTVTWPNGTDLAPEVLYSESVEVGRVPVLATVESVETIGGYRLRLQFTDGVTREVDLQRELHGPLFEPLRDEKQFRRVYVDADAGTIVWPNGANLAPEVLYRYEVHRASA